MIERVAQAIYDANPRYSVIGELAFEELGETHRQHVYQQARAAIEAMREPTEAMRHAGEDAAAVGIGRCVDDEALPRVWRTMIEEALR